MTLIRTETAVNENGFEVTTDELTVGVHASKKSVKYGEFYAAHHEGIKASLVYEIMRMDYDDQPVLYDDQTGQRYRVIRTYETHNGERIELTVTEISGRGGADG